MATKGNSDTIGIDELQSHMRMPRMVLGSLHVVFLLLLLLQTEETAAEDLVSSSALAGLTDCPSGFTRASHYDSCYMLSRENKDYTEAVSYCQSLNTRLIEITSQAEQDAIKSLVRVTGGDFWIGLTDRVTEGTFLWDSGTPVVYTDWYRGQPNDIYPGQDCAILSQSKDYNWDDKECDYRRRFICESTSSTTEGGSDNGGSDNTDNMGSTDNTDNTGSTANVNTDDCPSQFSERAGGCYMLISGYMVYSEAADYCTSHNSHLVEINSQQEQDTVQTLARASGGDFWIGLTDRVTEGQFVWNSGFTLDFSHWYRGQPNNIYPGQDCAIVSQYKQYQWDDKACTDTMKFICEYNRGNIARTTTTTTERTITTPPTTTTTEPTTTVPTTQRRTTAATPPPTAAPPHTPATFAPQTPAPTAPPPAQTTHRPATTTRSTDGDEFDVHEDEDNTLDTGSSCVDLDPKCWLWAAVGECGNNEVFMNSRCPASCGICTVMTCTDRHDKCQYWAWSGQCDTNRDFMEDTCPHSCGLCNVAADCADWSLTADCLFWAYQGACYDNPDYMLPKCAKTCGSCPGRPSTDKYVQCTDLAEESDCKYWAFIGQCDTNTDYMMENCARSCGACTGGKPPRTEVTISMESDTASYGPYTKTWCVGEHMDVQCPKGYNLNILEALFLYQENMCSNNDKTSGQACQGATGVEELSRLCDGGNSCTFTIDEDLARDQCTFLNTDNLYLEMTYTCQLPIFRQQACESTGLTLSCPGENQEIQIQAAMWGRQDSHTCKQGGSSDDVRCELLESRAVEYTPLRFWWPEKHLDGSTSPPITDVLHEECDGRQECRLYADDNFFGRNDSCANTRKYLDVSYTCAVCENYWETAENPIAGWNEGDCDKWVEAGECETSQKWMYANCRRSCTQCHLTDTCFNLHGDEEECEYWAYNGGCHINPEFMLINCARTCNYCDDVLSEPYPPTAEPSTTFMPPTVPDGVELKHELACNYTNAVLQCPYGKHIRVWDVFYGRRDPDTCSSPIPETTCLNEQHAADNYNMVRELCNGRESCWLWAGGDPPFKENCYWTYKYLEISYSCESCENVHDDDECYGWSDDPGPTMGCAKNKYWMDTNCYKSCSRCDSAESCDNLTEDRLCDWYASFEQCKYNAGFMMYSCRKSCRACNLWV